MSYPLHFLYCSFGCCLQLTPSNIKTPTITDDINVYERRNITFWGEHHHTQHIHASHAAIKKPKKKDLTFFVKFVDRTKYVHDI